MCININDYSTRKKIRGSASGGTASKEAGATQEEGKPQQSRHAASINQEGKMILGIILFTLLAACAVTPFFASDPDCKEACASLTKPHR